MEVAKERLRKTAELLAKASRFLGRLSWERCSSVLAGRLGLVTSGNVCRGGGFKEETPFPPT